MKWVRRRGVGSTELMAVGAIVLTMSAVMLPSFLRSNVAQDTQACWAVQRRIHSALEAYESDGRRSTESLDQLLPKLVAEGYLADLPRDPLAPLSPGPRISGKPTLVGPGADRAAGPYGRNAHGGIYCRLHGSAWDDGVPPPRAAPPPPPTELLVSASSAGPCGKKLRDRALRALRRQAHARPRTAAAPEAAPRARPLPGGL